MSGQEPANKPTISVAVMTHPQRLSLAHALVNSLKCNANLVVDSQPDGPPSPLRAAIGAWSRCPDNTTHHMVLQDDIRPSANFFELAYDAVCRRPESLISLYANSVSWNGAAARVALLAGYQWVTPPAGDYFPTLATIMPCFIAHSFAEYARSFADIERDDDLLLARFVSKYGHKTALRIPNLVEHDEHPSISGHDNHGIRRSVAFQGERSWSENSRQLASFFALPALFQRQALIRVPVSPLGDRWHTLTRVQHLRLVDASWPSVCDAAEEAILAIPDMPERMASARRYLRQLYLAGFSLGWVVATISREQGSTPIRGIWRDLALRTYVEAGFLWDAARIKWINHVEHLVELCSAAVIAGEVAVARKNASGL